MKKYLVTLGLLGSLTFLGLFFYFYKTSGKCRESITSALLAALVFFSWPSEAQSKGVDGFASQKQSRFSKRSGFFSNSSSRSNNNRSGSGKPDDDGSSGNDGNIPKYPQLESVERIKEHLRRMKEVSDSDAESEEDQCRIDQQIQSEGVKIKILD